MSTGPGIKAVERLCCDVCGQTSFSPVEAYTTQQWPLVRCDRCAFAFLARVPVYEALSDDIAWEKTRAEERVRREKRGWAALDRMTRWRLKLGWLIDHLRHRRAGVAGGRALEVGCGAATRIPEGAIPYGIEVSSELARQASPLYEARGGKVIHAPAAHAIEEFPDAFFDNIIMRSYLEHEAQPRLVLERAFAKLKPGGKISLRLPNFGSINRFVMRKNWCGFRFPDHVNYFTPRTLRKLGESVGYEFRWLNRLSLFDDNIIAELRKPMH